MFDKFGEFDSFEEINRKGQELKTNPSLIEELAKENGLDQMDAEDYIDGIVEELTSELMAAHGKLKIEAEHLEIQGVLADWVEELKIMCTEVPGMAKAVRKKGKSLAEYIALTADHGFTHKADVHKEIVEKTKEIKKIIGNHPFSIGIPNTKERKEIAKNYYLG